MSYSISARGSTKSAALEALAAQMANVVAGQPVHAKDETQALAQAKVATELIVDDETKDVHVSLSGSLSWTGVLGAGEQICGASINAYAAHIAKE